MNDFHRTKSERTPKMSDEQIKLLSEIGKRASVAGRIIRESIKSTGKNKLPTAPVIVVHLYEGVPGESLTVCSGDPMPFHEKSYSKYPRYLCSLCQWLSKQKGQGK